MPDLIAPLAAAMILQEVEPAEDRVALTAAAAFLESPWGLVPAVVRLQRAREEAEGKPTATGGTRLKPALVPVPNVVGSLEKDAVETLNKAKLRNLPDYHHSDEDKKDRVIVQQPPFGSPPIAEGSAVTLSIGKGPPPPEEEDLEEIIKGARKDMAELLKVIHELKDAADKASQALTEHGAGTLETAAPTPVPPAPPPPSPTPPPPPPPMPSGQTAVDKGPTNPT